MIKKNKIIFFGTPDFAVTSLDALYSNFNIHSVVTAPDRKSGRGQKLNESDVKKYAQKKRNNTNNMPLTFLYQSVIPYALLVFLLMKLFYYVFMVFIDK